MRFNRPGYVIHGGRWYRRDGQDCGPVQFSGDDVPYTQFGPRDVPRNKSPGTMPVMEDGQEVDYVLPSQVEHEGLAAGQQLVERYQSLELGPKKPIGYDYKTGLDYREDAGPKYAEAEAIATAIEQLPPMVAQHYIEKFLGPRSKARSRKDLAKQFRDKLINIIMVLHKSRM